MTTRPGTRLLALLVAVAAALTLASAPPTRAASNAAAADPVVWLCRPGLANNPCEIRLDTTNFTTSGGASVVKHARRASSKRPVDCFYVYPTVSNQVGINTTKARDPELASIAEYQAARFSSQCRMFAPIYRQAPLAGLATLPLSVETAYGDVRQAFRLYLARNKTRGFVLLGHSQGTMMLRKLIRQEIDTRPALRKRMIGALLIGGNVTVKAGKNTGGDFSKVPLCTRKGQYGCVVAYSTYSTDPLPLATFFGNTTTDLITGFIGHQSGAGYQVACTDPARLSGMTRPVGVLVPSKPFAAGPINLGVSVTAGGPLPTAKTTWLRPADRVTGACRTINGATVYRFNSRPGSRTLNEFPPTWGTHLVDVNLGLERLVRIVQLQTRSWLAAQR